MVAIGSDELVLVLLSRNPEIVILLSDGISVMDTNEIVIVLSALASGRLCWIL